MRYCKVIDEKTVLPKRCVDRKGQTYGVYAVLGFSRYSNTPGGVKTFFWNMRCNECGSEFEKQYRKTLPRDKRCPECPPSVSEKFDIRGQRFDSLIVLDDQPRREFDCWKFKCRCDCGNTVWKLGNVLTHKPTGTKIVELRSCGCRRKEYDQMVAGNHLAAGYRCDAEKRGISMELTNQEIIDLTMQCCVYCSAKPSRVFKVERKDEVVERLCNGIDRKRSDQPYTTENCVPCCKTCNILKGKMAFDDWTAYLNRVVNHWSPEEYKVPVPELDIPTLSDEEHEILDQIVIGGQRSAEKVLIEKKVVENTLTDEQILELTKTPCRYCGEPGAGKVRDYRRGFERPRNGIDRQNSDKGYTPTNTYPCCKICNWGKKDLPGRDWVNWIRRTVFFCAPFLTAKA